MIGKPTHHLTEHLLYNKLTFYKQIILKNTIKYDVSIIIKKGLRWMYDNKVRF